MGYHGLNSFQEVEAHYNSIKPLRGDRANKDIRPMETGFNRRYWWRRVIKINDNVYVLNDGNNIWWDESDVSTTAPITWWRDDNGVDYITIRNNWNKNSAVSRYDFLQKWLPKGMNFKYNQSGEHFIVANGTSYYLPKSKLDLDYQKRTYEVITDNKLTFKVSNGVFERVSELMPKQTKRVDKELDKKYAPLIKEFFNWTHVMMPMIGGLDSDTRSVYAKMLSPNTHHWYWEKGVKPEVVREAIENPESENRVALAVMCAFELNAMPRGIHFGSVGLDLTALTLPKLKKFIRRIAKLHAVDLV
jgi:hypothetical protein